MAGPLFGGVEQRVDLPPGTNLNLVPVDQGGYAPPTQEAQRSNALSNLLKFGINAASATPDLLRMLGVSDYSTQSPAGGVPGGVAYQPNNPPMAPQTGNNGERPPTNNTYNDNRRTDNRSIGSVPGPLEATPFNWANPMSPSPMGAEPSQYNPVAPPIPGGGGAGGIGGLMAPFMGQAVASGGLVPPPPPSPVNYPAAMGDIFAGMFGGQAPPVAGQQQQQQPYGQPPPYPQGYPQQAPPPVFQQAPEQQGFAPAPAYAPPAQQELSGLSMPQLEQSMAQEQEVYEKMRGLATGQTPSEQIHEEAQMRAQQQHAQQGKPNFFNALFNPRTAEGLSQYMHPRSLEQLQAQWETYLKAQPEFRQAEQDYRLAVSEWGKMARDHTRAMASYEKAMETKRQHMILEGRPPRKTVEAVIAQLNTQPFSEDKKQVIDQLVQSRALTPAQGVMAAQFNRDKANMEQAKLSKEYANINALNELAKIRNFHYQLGQATYQSTIQRANAAAQLTDANAQMAHARAAHADESVMSAIFARKASALKAMQSIDMAVPNLQQKLQGTRAGILHTMQQASTLGASPGVYGEIVKAYKEVTRSLLNTDPNALETWQKLQTFNISDAAKAQRVQLSKSPWTYDDYKAAFDDDWKPPELDMDEDKD